MFEDLKPGSEIKLTVTRIPTTKTTRETIRRLMLSSGEFRRVTKKAQNHRRHHADWRRRAGRLWNNRPKVARHFLGRVGETSTITYRPQIANDLKSVADYLSIEAG